MLAEAATAIKTAEDSREDNAEVDTVADPILESAQEPRSVTSIQRKVTGRLGIQQRNGRRLIATSRRPGNTPSPSTNITTNWSIIRALNRT